MLLTQLKNGATAKIEVLDLNDSTTHRLAALGLLSGCHIRMLNKKKSVVLIEYRGTFLALSNNIAEKISIHGEGV